MYSLAPLFTLRGSGNPNLPIRPVRLVLKKNAGLQEFIPHPVRLGPVLPEPGLLAYGYPLQNARLADGLAACCKKRAVPLEGRPSKESEDMDSIFEQGL